ncbi:hypothetical protein [Streptomyces collinus]|uniref:hypothetical protein n=1 Tax=Streptomyces collinus TaxID=42684 RepID=UPI0033F3144D
MPVLRDMVIDRYGDHCVIFNATSDQVPAFTALGQWVGEADNLDAIATLIDIHAGHPWPVTLPTGAGTEGAGSIDRCAVLAIPLIPKYAVVMLLTAVKALARMAAEVPFSWVHMMPRTAASVMAVSPARTATHPVMDRVFSMPLGVVVLPLVSVLSLISVAGSGVANVFSRGGQLRPGAWKPLVTE